MKSLLIIIGKKIKRKKKNIHEVKSNTRRNEVYYA